jgi:integrase
MVKIVLRQKERKDGSYPVVLSISLNRKTKIISTGYYCKKENWLGDKFSKKHPNYITRNRHLLKLEEKALKIIDDFKINDEDFTLSQFEQKFRGISYNKIDVSEFWNEKIDDLNRAGRTGNARAYKDTYNSFFKFIKNRKMVFKEITPELLDNYETFLRASGSEDGGIAFRMRELRALFNDAIRKGAVDNKFYPFNDYKISKLKGKGIKRALSFEEFNRLKNLDINMHPNLIDAKNYFLFSYYTRGMNFHDMMTLKWDNIDGDRIFYTRSKTKGRFSVKILEPVKEILAYYRNQKRLTPYVFPILLRTESTPIQVEYRKKKTISRYNKQLKEIASLQGIEKSISSYTARHSNATHLKFKGASIDIISQSLGHKDVNVTRAYLKEFGDEIIDDAMNKLLEEPRLKYA